MVVGHPISLRAAQEFEDYLKPKGYSISLRAKGISLLLSVKDLIILKISIILLVHFMLC